MNGTNEERLYNLLPALYRQRDLAADGALRAMMSVLESQFKVLETDITAGYNNWFVETCDAWVLPYLAELVGMPNLGQEKHTFSTQRRQVANTIGYRRRKGIMATLEHVLRDATGWLVYAVEFDRQLAVTQHLARACREQARTVDVRCTGALAELGGPFDSLVHTIKVCRRSLAGAKLDWLRSGQSSMGAIGVFVWRLRSFRMTNSRPSSMYLLDFLNRAKSASEIAQRIVDDPGFGPDSRQAYGVRPSLAQHIREERDKLPNGRFESLQQVDDVRGVGPDTLHDMLATFPGLYPGLYSFHPLGVDMPLFNWPQYISEIDHRAESFHMPLALSRAQFAADLEEYESQFGHRPEEIRPPNSRLYGPDRGLNVAVWPPGSSKLEPDSIPPSRVLSMDLSQWNRTIAGQVHKQYRTKQVAIDVQRGRLAFLPNEWHSETKPPIDDKDIRLTYSYGFSTSMGGGPYHRDLRRLFSIELPFHVDFHIDVAKGARKETTATEAEGQGMPACVSTLSQALNEWHRYQHRHLDKSPRGIIRILDNGLYDEVLRIWLHTGSHLTIVADNGTRPVFGNNAPLIVVCEGEGSEERRQLDLSGLLIHGGLCILTRKKAEAGMAGGLIVTIGHCTVVTREGRRLKPAGIQVASSEEAVQGMELTIERSIVGSLYLPPKTESLRVRHSIVENGSGYAIAANSSGAQPGPVVNLESATIFGQVHAQKVTARNVIFCSPLKAPAPETEDQIQHSYVPQGSTTLEGEPHRAISSDVAPPRFTSTRYGDPGYAQLSLDCPYEIRGGATDGSEMGAFHDLHQLQAEENLREVLEEYLPVGLQASIHYVT